MSAITWLHLSDLHFRKDGRHMWDENIVLLSLLNDVRERIVSDGLRPDFIVISGDIAFSSQPQEYGLAREFFDKLLMATGASKDRLFIVPGNHDVNRMTISRGAMAIARSLENREALAEALADDHDRRSIMRKLDGYAGFVRDYFGSELCFDDEHYFYVRNLDLVGQRVAVLGLNSAWLSIGDQDFGRLALGERQVRQALDAAMKANLRIALMHHPFDSLYQFDRNDCEALLMDSCDFILHGHLHHAGVLSMKTPDAGAMILAAGACYETRQYPNAYNWVQLDLEAGQGTIFLRTYSDQRGGFWTKDVMTYKNIDNGEFVFPLSSRKKIIPKKEKRQPSLVAPVKLEANYLRRMQTVCNALPLAVIDPKAVERTFQKTMDLVPMYVALNTKTQLAVTKKEKRGRRKPGELEQMTEPGRETRPLTALEAAAREQYMVLLGDPGSGKSTFANYLSLCLAGGRLEHLRETGALPGERWLAHLEPAWIHGPLLPLQIVLRQFAKTGCCDGTAEGLWNYVDETLSAQGLSDFIPYLRKQLFEGGVIVLLDGLDEVADLAIRQIVRDAVLEFVTTHNHPHNRYLVTCRGYAYEYACCQLNNFVVHTLASFNQGQIDNFIGCWYSEVCRLGWKTESEAQELTQRLRDATRRPDLAPLAANPLQLAMMASLHFSWGRLPDDRVELYQEMVRLLLVRWQEARLGQEAGVTQKISTGNLESALEQVAFIAHRTQASAEGTADISQEMLLSVLKDFLDGSWDRAGEMVNYIQDRAGLLIDRGRGTYTFPHRSYQEYLAGSYLAVQPNFPDEATKLVSENYVQWREVTLWAVGAMTRLKKMPHVAVDVAAALCPHEALGQDVLEADWRKAYLAGEALLQVGLKEVQSRDRHKQVLARVQRWLVALIEQGVLTPTERAAAGRALAKLGDPRFRPDALWLPNESSLGFVEIPAGTFTMGTKEEDIPALIEKAGGEKDWYKWETPQHPLNLKTFYISRYPVTNAQFNAFVEAGGYYKEPRYWKEAEAVKVWQKKGHVKDRLSKESRNKPYDFGEPLNLPNHPVVGVNWYEALAYARWLNDQFRTWSGTPEQLAYLLREDKWEITLPSEAQWEKAARGEDGRIFPWENNEVDLNLANYDKTGIGSTSAVGCFPKGASPYGVQDMSGNVWEWTRSLWGKNWEKPDFKYPYDPKDKQREDPKAGIDVLRVLRGGSLHHDARFVRCACRDGDDPGIGFSYIGFRVVLSPL